MSRAVRLLAALLLASVALRGAAADDEHPEAIRRLLPEAVEVPGPVLGLLPLGTWRADRCLVPEDEPRLFREAEDPAEIAELVDDAVAWLVAQGAEADVAPHLLRRIAIDVEVAASDGRRHRARLVAVPGRRATFLETATLRVVPDYEVELACDNSGGLRPSALGDPQGRTFLEGVALEVRPYVVGDTRVALEVFLQAGRFEADVERLDTRALYLGAVELPRYRGALLAASGAVEADSPMEITLHDDDVGRFDLRLVPRVLDVPGAADHDRVQTLDARMLLAWRTAVGFDDQPDAYPNPPGLVLPAAVWRPPLLDPGALWEHLDHAMGEVDLRMLPHGDVWVATRRDAAARVRRDLAAWATRAARTVRVDLVLRAGDDVLGRASVPVLTGRSGFFRIGRDRALLLDADVEVG